MYDFRFYQACMEANTTSLTVGDLILLALPTKKARILCLDSL
jgi:hypothetical protein